MGNTGKFNFVCLTIRCSCGKDIEIKRETIVNSISKKCKCGSIYKASKKIDNTGYAIEAIK